MWFSWNVGCLVCILLLVYFGLGFFVTGLNPWTWSWVNWLSFWYSVAQSQPQPQPPPPPPQPFVVFSASPPPSLWARYWGGLTYYQRTPVMWSSPSASAPPAAFLQTSITSSTPAPPNWTESLAEATAAFADPKHKLLWPFIEIPVPEDSAEFVEIQKLFEGVDHLQMVRLHRVVNPELWKRFDQTRKGLLTSKSNDINLLSGLGLSDEEIAHKIGRTVNVEESPYCDNVVLLFHGTRSEENIVHILSDGLDDRLSFVPGIFFSDCPQKARKYDTTGELFIFAVMLGDCLAVDQISQIWGQREPPKALSQRRNMADRYFTSIVGRRTISTKTGPTNSSTAKRGPNEYVIFNRALCCPLYILTYTDTTSSELSTPGGEDFETARLLLPAFAWVDRDSMTTTEAKSPFYASTIFQAMATSSEGQAPQDSGEPEESDTDTDATDNSNRNQDESESEGGEEGETEACQICAFKYPTSGDASTGLWETLPCSPLHKMCANCFTTLRTTGTTMSGQTHSCIKCPYCKTLSTSTPGSESGLALALVPPIPIGDCPTGTMTVWEILEAPDGYEGLGFGRRFWNWVWTGRGGGTIAINYKIPAGATHGPALNRTAVLPNTPEGRTVLELLRTAWDHRLTFRIGTSATTGRINVLVWNIHHKTYLTGGEATHSYPDPTYLQRVRQQLAGYGIRGSDYGDRDTGTDTDTEAEPVEILY